MIHNNIILLYYYEEKITYYIVENKYVFIVNYKFSSLYQNIYS